MSAERDAARVRIPPPVVPLAAIAMSVVLDRLFPLSLGLETPGRTWIGWTIVGVSFCVLGLWPVVLFRRSGQSENPYRSTPSLVDIGPFRFTRNPMYLQMVLICLGMAIIWSNAWLLGFTPIVALALQRYAIRPEEAYLEGKFGGAYRDYKSRVRRWF